VSARRWYHGDQSCRKSFRDQRWDRPRGQADPNAEGPGLYWTTDHSEAWGYASPAGCIYTGTLKPGVKLLGAGGALRPLVRTLVEFAEPEARYTFATNWNVDSDTVEDVERIVLRDYVRQEGRHLFNVALALYRDLYSYDASGWVTAVRAAGYAGTLIGGKGMAGDQQHLVLYDLEAMKVLKQEPFEAFEE